MYMFYMCLDYVPMNTSVIKCLSVSDMGYIDLAGTIREKIYKEL